MLAVVSRDITDKVRAATDREAQQRAQRDFVANAAHELRTPLTAVIAAIETLDRGVIHDPAARERFFGHIRREATRLSRLCDSLLLLADTQSGSPLRTTTIPLAGNAGPHRRRPPCGTRGDGSPSRPPRS